MARVTSGELIHLAKSKKSHFDVMRSGENLNTRTNYSVDKIRNLIVKDRMTLSRSMLKVAEALLNNQPQHHRNIVSRSYYAMYHMFRAVSFYVNGGDDFEAHSELSKGIPSDFPNALQWKNNLKQARLERNKADYDPYPRGDIQFRDTANSQVNEVKALMPIARNYLTQKGWTP